ncbi:FAD-binding domain-containing protein [Setomelanomma holmii]|uniref:Delta(24)-sterol reductase n=1 Tax=Setomelanomma holmii TaxID=210430 RepID=A0A9P4HG79_9PLEO|nr:FAD-binding domain-containing protein [Setomelanomma holmii]
MDTYTIDQHDQAVRKLADEVARFHADQVPFRINHGPTNSTRSRDSRTPQLRIAHLNHVLDIDTRDGIATVEPNVPLDSLVSMTLGRGLMPLVVMEFPGITVGGGFSGASGESTGWKEGLFDCSVDEIEMILGDGSVVKATKGGHNSDLFDGARCTLGTLGVVTLLKVRLTQAADAIQLSYHHTTSVEKTIDSLTKLCDDDNTSFDFIEALQYGMTKGVIVTGTHVSSKSGATENLPISRFDRAHDPWFYMHARETSASHTELVPTQSYLFRHDRGAFWSGEVFFKYYGLPNNRFVRWLLNPLLTARAIYKAMLATDSADGAVIQDLLLPLETSGAFVEYVNEVLNIWPIWICPIRKHPDAANILGWPFYKAANATAGTSRSNSRRDGSASTKGELILNFGVWGPTDPTPTAIQKTNRDLEQKLRELRGMKVPYAANFYTEEEFWALYDRDAYEKLRKKWHAEALPSMYDKVRRKQADTSGGDDSTKRPQKLTWKEAILQIWPLGGLYQTFHVLFR